MFEKFTEDARMTVVGAQGEAMRTNAVAIDTPHLLAGLAAIEQGRGAQLLGELGVSSDDITAELDRIRRRGGVSDIDAEALAEFGIDIDQIVDRVEQAHGPGALAAGRGRAKRGHLPFTIEAKKVLELSLREAVKLRDKHIGQEHILLALAQQRGISDLLARRGADYEAVRRVVRQRKAG